MSPVRAPYTGVMRIVLGFVGGLAVGFMALWPVAVVLGLFTRLLGMMDRFLELVLAIDRGTGVVLVLGWLILFGVAGVWVTTRRGITMRSLLGFVGGLIVGFLTLGVVLYVFPSFLRPLFGEPFGIVLLYSAWPLVFGTAGVWVAPRLGRRLPSESPG